MSQQDPPPTGPVPPSGTSGQPGQPLPPPQAPGQPGYGPPPTQSGYGQPPAGPPGQPPYQPYGATSPGGPRKRRTGLIIGVVAGLVVLAGIIVAIVLLATNGDEEKADEPDSTSSPTATTGSPSTSPTDQPEEGTLQGDGYSYELPDGWNDVTEEALAQNPPGAIDTVAAWGETFNNSRANLIVETAPANGQTDLEALRAEWENNLTGTSGGEAQPTDGIQIGGEDSIGTTVDITNSNGVRVHQIAYLTIHDDTIYSIGFNAERGDEEAQQAFDEVMDSWSWQ